MTETTEPGANATPEQSRAPSASGLMTRFAGLTPSTYDPETRSVEAVLSVGAAVDRFSYVETLAITKDAIDLKRAQDGLVALLNCHDRWSIGAVLGSVRECRIEGNKLIGRLYFGDTEAGREAEGMVARGELKGISVGYRVTKWEITRAVEEQPEHRHATGWTLMEVSLVPVPADADTGVRSDAGDHPPVGATAVSRKDDTMSATEQRGADAPAKDTAPASQAGNEAPETRSAPETRNEPNAPAQRGEDSPKDGARQNDVFSARDALDFITDARAAGGDTAAARADELVRQNADGKIGIDAARMALLKSMGQKQAEETSGIRSTAIEMGDDARAKFMRGAEAAVLMRAGVADTVRNAAKLRDEKVDLDPGEFRGCRMVDLARISLEMSGERVRSHDPREIIGQAFTATRAGMQQGTSDFGILLGNVMHKTLQASYAITPDTWRQIAAIGSVSDFREHSRYIRGSMGTLDDKLETGEFKNKPMTDGSFEKIKLKTKGNIVAITREAMVNDDLGIFNAILTELGRAAKLSIEVDFWAMLAENSGLGPTMDDGKTLFHADHNNIAATGAAPGVDSLDAIRVLMAQQKDPSGNEYLDLRPSVLAVPIGLGANARVLNGAEYDPDVSGKFQRPNVVRGLFNTIVDTPRLSGTRWYVFGDPAGAPTFEVVFLNGQQEPMLEQKDSWRLDGTEFRVVFDYGMDAVNYRSAATNAGA